MIAFAVMPETLAQAVKISDFDSVRAHSAREIVSGLA
jgi:hypothetical protein